MNTAWKTDRKSWKLWCVRRNCNIVAITETWWMSHTTGVPQSMATSSSEEIGKEEEMVGQPCMPGNVLIVNDGDDGAECSWVRISFGSLTTRTLRC